MSPARRRGQDAAPNRRNDLDRVEHRHTITSGGRTPKQPVDRQESIQGSEYTAGTVRAACTRLGITQSMGRPGSALDNAVIESWHSTVEFELRRLEHFDTLTQARARVAAWIEDYNHDRRHSALGMRSPIDYELTHQARDHEPEQAA